MKTLCKIAVLTIIVCILLSFSSCIPVKQKYNISGSIEDIRSIDIYQAGNTEDNYILNIRGQVPPVYTIPNDKVDEFVKELKSQKYKWTIWLAAVDYIREFSDGYTVVIEYQDGNYDVYAEHGIMLGGYYRPADYHGSESWNDFIEKYMQEN